MTLGDKDSASREQYKISLLIFIAAVPQNGLLKGGIFASAIRHCAKRKKKKRYSTSRELKIGLSQSSILSSCPASFLCILSFAQKKVCPRGPGGMKVPHRTQKQAKETTCHCDTASRGNPCPNSLSRRLLKKNKIPLLHFAKQGDFCSSQTDADYLLITLIVWLSVRR